MRVWALVVIYEKVTKFLICELLSKGECLGIIMKRKNRRYQWNWYFLIAYVHNCMWLACLSYSGVTSFLFCTLWLHCPFFRTWLAQAHDMKTVFKLHFISATDQTTCMWKGLPINKNPKRIISQSHNSTTLLFRCSDTAFITFIYSHK